MIIIIIVIIIIINVFPKEARDSKSVKPLLSVHLTYLDH